MKINNMISSVKTTAVKHAPEIMVTTGIISVVASTVLLIKNSTRVSDILDNRRESLSQLKELQEQDEGYSEELLAQDTKKINLVTGINLVKTEAPAITAEIIGLFLIGKGFSTLNHRYKDLGVYASGLLTSFMAYRKRVDEVFGEGSDDKVMYGVERKKVSIAETDPKTGDVKIKKEECDVATNPFGVSRYAMYFDKDTTQEFDENDLENEGYIMGIQAQANDRLQYGDNGAGRARKVLTLNEVYEMLGLPQTYEGAKVGWSLDSPNGDHQVIFKVMKVAREDYDGADTYHKCYLIDFNVDGSIEQYLTSHDFNKMAIEAR